MDPSSLSVKELKQILVSRGVDISDCVEKADLVKRLTETKDQPERVSQKKSIDRRHVTIAGLDCITLDNSNDAPNLIVVVSHGYGANNEDLLPMAEPLIKAANLQNVLFVFPNAVLSLGGVSRAWWHIDIMALQARAMSGQIDSLFAKPPVGLDTAREKMLQLIHHLKQQYNLPTNRFVLAGFSQGSMLSIDAALHLEESVAAVCVFSGVLLCPNEWRSLISKHKGLKVLQCHGIQDPLLPFALGTQLKSFFETNHIPVEFLSFPGGHTVPPQGLNRWAELLKTLS